ncbi:hypothetical protein D3C72_1299570 [compost metagenome]
MAVFLYQPGKVRQRHCQQRAIDIQQAADHPVALQLQLFDFRMVEDVFEGHILEYFQQLVSRAGIFQQRLIKVSLENRIQIINKTLRRMRDQTRHGENS